MSGEEKKGMWEGGCWKLKFRVGEREEGQREDGCRWCMRTWRNLGQRRGIWKIEQGGGVWCAADTPNRDYR